MFGAIVGDIAGSPWEGTGVDDRLFDLIPPDARMTDDSVCTLAILEALLTPPLIFAAWRWESRFRKSLQTWYHAFPNRDYGALFASWAAKRQTSRGISNANGAVMRVSGIAHLTKTPKDAKQLAVFSTIPSHNSPEARQAAAGLVLAMQNVSEKGPKVLADIAVYQLQSGLPDLDRLIRTPRAHGGAMDTVLIAFAVMQRAESFAHALRLAMQANRDTDTQACVVGALAELVWPIPKDLAQKSLACLPPPAQAVLKRACQQSSLYSKDHVAYQAIWSESKSENISAL